MAELELLPPELDELANEVGEFICYWGFKKIHGRLWTHIYLAKEPLDAGRLMQRLKVSKALVSLSLNDLLKYDVIREHCKSPRGTQTYLANPNVLQVILNVLKLREGKMLDRAGNCHRTLVALGDERLMRANLESLRISILGQMISEAQKSLSSLLELSQLNLQSWKDLNETTTLTPL